MDANFVDVETLCEKYRALSSSQSQLYRHLKEGYVSSLQHSLPGVFSPILPIPIITFRSVVPVIGLDQFFKGRHIQSRLLLLALKFSPSSQTPVLQLASIFAMA